MILVIAHFPTQVISRLEIPRIQGPSQNFRIMGADFQSLSLQNAQWDAAWQIAIA